MLQEILHSQANNFHMCNYVTWTRAREYVDTSTNEESDTGKAKQSDDSSQHMLCPYLYRIDTTQHGTGMVG